MKSITQRQNTEQSPSLNIYLFLLNKIEHTQQLHNFSSQQFGGIQIKQITFFFDVSPVDESKNKPFGQIEKQKDLQWERVCGKQKVLYKSSNTHHRRGISDPYPKNNKISRWLWKEVKVSEKVLFLTLPPL